MKRVVSIILTVIMFAGIIIVPGVTASAADIKTGTLVTFGSYPQTSVVDSGTLAKLNAQTLSWKYYDYYCDGKQENYMKFADVTLNGEHYRAVTFTHYRPDWWDGSASATYQDDNGYEPDKIYWFKFEPIVWRVLDASAGLILAENLIDSQPFHNVFYSNNGNRYGDQSYTHYASNWAYSSLRSWMNDDFYNTAFSAEKSYIKNTSLTTPSDDSSSYDAELTKDKVFLLSREDVLNESYGFSSSYGSGAVTNRIACGTDYARCQGLWVDSSTGVYYSGASWWRLRSPDGGKYTDGVDGDGHVNFSSNTDSTSGGIRPALNVNLQSAISQSLIKITDSSGLVINGPSGTNADDFLNYGFDRFSYDEDFDIEAGKTEETVIKYISSKYDFSDLTVTSSDESVLKIEGVVPGQGSKTEITLEENQHVGTVKIKGIAEGMATVTVAGPNGIKCCVSVTVTPHVHEFYFKKENTSIACKGCDEETLLSPKLGYKYGRDNFSFDHKDVKNYNISPIGYLHINKLLKMDVIADIANIIARSNNYKHNKIDNPEYGTWGGSCYGMSMMNSYFFSDLSPKQYGNDLVAGLSIAGADLLKINQDTKLKDSINIMMYSQLSLSSIFYMSGNSVKNNKQAVNLAENLSNNSYPPVIKYNTKTYGHAVSIIGLLPKDTNKDFFIVAIYDCNHPDEPRYIGISKNNYSSAYLFILDKSEGIVMDKRTDKDGNTSNIAINIVSLYTSPYMNNIGFWAPGLSSAPEYTLLPKLTQKRTLGVDENAEEEYDELLKNYVMFLIASDDVVTVTGNDGTYFSYKDEMISDTNIGETYVEYLDDFGVTKILVPRTADSYEIKSNGQYYASFKYDYQIASAYCENGGNASFSTAGKVSVDTKDTNSYFEVAAFKNNLIDNSDVAGVSLSGNGSSAHIDYSGENPKVESADLKDLTISVQHNDQDLSVDEITMDGAVSEEAILVKNGETDGNTIVIDKTKSEYSPGDVDGNGQILADDARLALRASAKLEELSEAQLLAADVDGNNQVLAGDARQILRFSAKLIQEFEKADK